MKATTDWAAEFRTAGEALVQSHIERLRADLTYDTALELRDAEFHDVVVARKEAQLTIFRQTRSADPGHVLVTVQLARHGLGGVVSYKREAGLVFERGVEPRDATAEELL